MAKICDICSKGKMSGNKISHSNRRSKRSWAPNLKKIKVEDNGSIKTLEVCTRCIRTGKFKKTQ
ncbi:MAG TPA: 50S ribosomal protein L28 [Bacillota bacterium]|nr:50S ribosomal protein L28 [Bacillota bacterium]